MQSADRADNNCKIELSKRCVCDLHTNTKCESLVQADRDREREVESEGGCCAYAKINRHSEWQLGSGAEIN